MTVPLTLRAPNRQPEAELQGAVIQYLRLALRPPAFAFAVPNGGSRDKREAAKLRWQGVLPGVPDLILAFPPQSTGHRAAGIELKSATGRLSPEQRDVGLQLTACGWCWACCRSIEEVEDVVRSWGLVLNASTRMAA